MPRGAPGPLLQSLAAGGQSFGVRECSLGIRARGKRKKGKDKRVGPADDHLLPSKSCRKRRNIKPLTTTTSFHLTLLKFQNLTKKIK
jgi:hypothetical protein